MFQWVFCKAMQIIKNNYKKYKHFCDKVKYIFISYFLLRGHEYEIIFRRPLQIIHRVE